VERHKGNKPGDTQEDYNNGSQLQSGATGTVVSDRTSERMAEGTQSVTARDVHDEDLVSE
jgi:hypothetical protein